MKNILIFAGTTEGRTLSELLCASGIRHMVSVATEYGEMTMKEHPLAKIRMGRLEESEMETFFREQELSVVVDATHPYAEVVTKNIKTAAKAAGICYLRLEREHSRPVSYEHMIYFESHEACAKALEEMDGHVLLTTGSKDLAVYASRENLQERLYVRVLPGLESLELCLKNGIHGKQILALHGPFTKELNEALIRQYDISCLVTKMSGKNSGYEEKIEAAKEMGIPVFVIGKETKSLEAEHETFRSVCQALEEICGCPIRPEISFSISLCGIGMGNPGTLTKEAESLIHSADLLFGAARMIAPFTPKLDKQPFYRAEQIIPYLKEFSDCHPMAFTRQTCSVVILFSGDSGFYSGAQRLAAALREEMEDGALKGTVQLFPGISSVSYFSSLLGESYQDAQILSIHGRMEPNLAGKIAGHAKTFLLMDGSESLRMLGETLCGHGLASCEVFIGIQLSYPEQRLLKLTPEECRYTDEAGLMICLIKNPDVQVLPACHGLPDSAFLRDKVPMTKEEVREVSICKLHPKRDSVVYDVGSGTGSIAMEVAGLSSEIQVYAIERKEDAVALIRKNCERFARKNVTVIQAEAPDGMDILPVPTHAFIGGSGKHMREILDLLYRKNPSMRIVVNAVTLETLGEIQQLLEQFPVTEAEFVQMQVTRTKSVGSYHMMQAENPVWICSFTFLPEVTE